MSSEQVFLDAIRAAPADPVNRLVYADWLEETGDPRARYLRLELELAETDEEDPVYAEREAELQKCRRKLHPLWVHEVSRAYDLVLLGYDRAEKIITIRVIRELTWCGLAAAKGLSETLPSVILRGVSRMQAEHGKDRFHSIRSANTVIRLSVTADRPPAVLPQEETGYALILVRFPDTESERQGIVKAVGRMLDCDFVDAEPYVGLGCPVSLRVYATEEEARRALELFAFPEAVAVWPVDSFAISTNRKSAHSERGNLVLHDFPPESKIQVIPIVRDITGLGLLAAKNLVESARPVTLLRGVPPEHAAEILARFGSQFVVRFERAD
jgi:uncharacterized protein (TIGR02996 family)